MAGGPLWRVDGLELGHVRRLKPLVRASGAVLRLRWVVLVVRVDVDGHRIFCLGMVVTLSKLIMLIMLHLRVVN